MMESIVSDAGERCFTPRQNAEFRNSLSRALSRRREAAFHKCADSVFRKTGVTISSRRRLLVAETPIRATADSVA